MPLVSVIVPNYNHYLYLKQRLDSILEQDFQDFELIILDDCSMDESRKLIDQYKSHPKVSHVVYNQTNSGSTFVQWKKGFDLAQGKYIWIAESDDYANRTFLGKLVSELEKDPKATLAFSHSNIVNAESHLLSEDWDRVRLKDFTLVSHFEGEEFVKKRMLFNNSIYNASMVVFRANVLNKVAANYARLTYSGDWMFWVDICLQGNVIRYNERLSYFRQHTQKVTPRAVAKGIRFLEGKIVMQHIFDELNLTKTQCNVVVGRLVKSLITSKTFESKKLKWQVYQDIVCYFHVTRGSILLYELDKRLNFSNLGIQKNRYL